MKRGIKKPRAATLGATTASRWLSPEIICTEEKVTHSLTRAGGLLFFVTKSNQQDHQLHKSDGSIEPCQERIRVEFTHWLSPPFEGGEPPTCSSVVAIHNNIKIGNL